ncbi:hypothetical protein FWH58_02920 [Candidatus Saccharibacteria bacterium]|nr:hypothetical protein [Candidatus Saccharibacteria bacterium]
MKLNIKVIAGIAVAGLAAAVLVVVLIINGGKDNGNNVNKNDQTGDTTNNQPAHEPVMAGQVDLADNSNYFIMIDGVRFDTNTKIKEVLDKGYTVRSSTNLDLEMEAGKGSIDLIYFQKGGETCFGVNPVNRTDGTVKKSESTISKFSLYDTWCKNITIVGDLTLGSTIAEVKAVFGEPGSTSTRASRKASGATNGTEKHNVYLTYMKSNSTDGMWVFYFYDDETLGTIMMTSNR